MAKAQLSRARHVVAMLLTLGCETELAPEQTVGSEAMAQSPHRAPASACSSELVVERSMALDPNCVYTSIRIVKSDVVLDCAGATIDPGYKGKYGILIGPADTHSDVRNVVVRNCWVRNSRSYGIFIGITGCDRDKLKFPPGKRYGRHPHDILIENAAIEYNGGTGLYVDDYVSGVEVRHSTFLRNAGPAIYLEHHSRKSHIHHNRMVENGHGPKFVPRGGGLREAIAVDASEHNLIEDNVFIDNHSGGIFLYRNCWENPTNRCQVERPNGARYNVVRRNRIEGGYEGIWIASRQHRSADKPNCGKRPDPERGIFNDEAKHNVVVDNEIRNVERGILIEDDHNVVERNRVFGARKSCIVAGSQQRVDEFGAPIAAIRVIDNECHADDRGRAGQAVEVVPGTKGEIKGNEVKKP